MVTALFASLLDAEPWAGFLDTLSVAAAADWATLILTPRGGTQPGLILTPGADPGIDQDYASRLFAGDPFTGLPDGKVTHFRDFVTTPELEHDPAFRDFIARASTEILGVEIREPGGLELRLRLTRAAQRPPFTSSDAAALERIVPDLRLALRLFDRMAAGETEQRIYAGAVAQMAVGLVILNRHGKTIRMNARAAAILAERDGIALHGDAVRIEDAELARQFHARIARPNDHAPPLTLRIERPSGQGDLLLVAGSAHAPDYVTAGGGPASVIYLTDPTHAPRISPDALCDLLGLTQAEAGIAADIAGGFSLADTAARRAISPNTVRAHLRAIFTKTGVKRQSQLVHLVHHSLPGLTRPAD